MIKRNRDPSFMEFIISLYVKENGRRFHVSETNPFLKSYRQVKLSDNCLH